MSKTRKRYLKIIFVFLIIGTICFFLFGLNSFKSQLEKNVIIIDNDATFKRKNNKWYSLTSSTDLKSYNWTKFSVFENNKYLGKYYLVNSGEWYLFDSDKNAKNYNGNLLALGGNTNYQVLDYELVDSTDNSYINQVLEDNNVDVNSSLTSNYQIDFDIDNDGTKESLYVISNRFPLDPVTSNKYFGFVFLVKNNKIINLYEDVTMTDDSYSGCKPYITSILDVDNDKKYEVILSCAYYSNSGNKHKLYKFNDDEFNLLVSN